MAKRKKRKRKTGRIVAVGIVLILALAGAIGWSMLQKEHAEARAVEIGNVDFGNVPDGTYTGVYPGGMYGWRENRVQVTVEGGRVTGIKTVYSKTEITGGILDELYGRVISAQSLDVDAVSEATLTSKAYLKSVENAFAGSSE